METISFALGVASILIVLSGAVTVWLTLKVKKIIKENNEFYYLFNNLENNVRRENVETLNTLHNRIDDVLRTNEYMINDVQQRIDMINNENDRKLQDCFRYTDSRIDKLVNNPKFGVIKDKTLLTD